LGEVPLLLEIRETGDAGTPVCASAPQSVAAAAFRAIAAAVTVALAPARRAAPKIIID
jgi:ATP-binding protein involved in chromosome partitioning